MAEIVEAEVSQSCPLNQSRPALLHGGESFTRRRVRKHKDVRHSFFGTSSGGDLAEIRGITADLATANSHWQSFARICQGAVNPVCANQNTANVNTDGTLAQDNSSSGFTGAWLVRQGASSVPVPATLALLGLGLAGIGYQRRKQVKAA